jgi:hypothetical protein
MLLPPMVIGMCHVVVLAGLWSEQGISIWVRFTKLQRYFLPKYNSVERASPAFLRTYPLSPRPPHTFFTRTLLLLLLHRSPCSPFELIHSSSFSAHALASLCFAPYLPPSLFPFFFQALSCT